jgi:hypothetical protein
LGEMALSKFSQLIKEDIAKKRQVWEKWLNHLDCKKVMI